MSQPFTLRPAYCLEDYSVTLTVDGAGSIAAWTFEALLYTAAGILIASPTAFIVDPGARTVRISITGENFTTAADLTLTLYRTNEGSRTMVYTAVLEVTDPQAPNAWGTGFAQ